MSRSAHSGAAVASGTLPVERLERLWGWGRTSSATSYVYRPSTPEGVLQVFELARAHGATVGLRGAGQSYGDAALNAGNICLDLSCMKRILAWDPGQGIIHVEPGVTIEQLWQYAIEDGWWPAVVPGTMFATLGGCLGMNVHGKNNWAVGPIGEHVVEFDLLLPNGEVRRCSREHEAELFHAAIGGFGMLGCFLSVTLRLKKVHSGLLDVEPFVARSLDEMIEVFEARMRTADHLVGWVDGLAQGGQVGRGVVHQANHLGPGDDPEPARTLRVDRQTLPATLMGVVPASVVWRLMRPFMNEIGLRLINELRYRWSRASGRRVYRQSHAAPVPELRAGVARCAGLQDAAGARAAERPPGTARRPQAPPRGPLPHVPCRRRVLAGARVQGHRAEPPATLGARRRVRRAGPRGRGPPLLREGQHDDRGDGAPRLWRGTDRAFPRAQEALRPRGAARDGPVPAAP
ncbi:MAG: FAD-binding oxidoreductase [Actinobacteria bacterium]|nr:MAG: FAD-binding oxidoreductase [Actinomycetota bacterium]